MGGENSTMYGCLEEEFSRLTQGKKKRVHLGQVLQLKLPTSAWNLDSAHLGVLFVLYRYLIFSQARLEDADQFLSSQNYPASLEDLS